MQRRTIIPMIINVVAHLLNQLGNEVRSYGFVLAAFKSQHRPAGSYQHMS